MSRIAGYHELLKLTAPGLRSCQQLLDERAATMPPVLRRRLPRYPMRSVLLQVAIKNPHGEQEVHVLYSRDATARGISALGVMFLYPGSRFAVEVPVLNGGTKRMRGRVGRCEHVTGKLHITSLLFDQDMPVPDYLDVAAVEPCTVPDQPGIILPKTGTISPPLGGDKAAA